jgi:hypothetical protein
MLNEIYNTKTEKLSNYCIIFEPDAIKFIDFLKANIANCMKFNWEVYLIFVKMKLKNY